MRKTYLLYTLIVLLAFGAAACQRPASRAPVPTGTAIEDDIASIYSRGATEAALALTGQPSGEEAQEADATEAAAQPVTVITATPTPESESEEEEEEKDKDDDDDDDEKFEPSVPSKYTLRKGEFPYCIARRFNIDVDALLNANGLNRSSATFPGQQLTIPQNAAKFDDGPRSLSPHPTEYTASAGDTFYTIACEFGDVYPEEIAQENGKGNNYEPTAGEKIKIP